MGPGTGGPLARSQLLAAAMVTPEDLTAAANSQSPPTHPLHSLPADVLFVALEGSPKSRTLALLMACVLPGSAPSGQRGCRRPQLCTTFHCLGWWHCPAGRNFPLCRWKLGCLWQQMACFCSASFRHQLIAAMSVTHIKRVARMKNEVYGVLKEAV